jgi:hypothetical protein
MIPNITEAMDISKKTAKAKTYPQAYSVASGNSFA